MVMLAILIFTITCFCVQIIHNCSLIVEKKNWKEEGSLEKPYRKYNMIVGAPIHGKVASNDAIWLGPAILSRRSGHMVISSVLGFKARWTSSKILSVN